MKKLLLSMVIAGAALTASAQSPVKFGIKAGVTLPTWSISEDDEGALKSDLSFYIGGLADIPVSDMFSVQAGLTLSGKGAKIDGKMEDEDGNNISLAIKQSLMYLEVPVNAVVNIPAGDGKIFFGAGPYFGYAISGKSKVKGSLTVDGQTASDSQSEDLDFDSDYKRVDYGVNALAGYQLGNGLNIHAGYGLGLANIIRSDEGEIKNRVFSVGLGFSF
jgi:opacity protein-like surface antigen